jgi:hypothetical protein
MVINSTNICDQAYQWLATGLWFSPSTPISSTNKTCRHDVTELLLKVALNTITLTLQLKNLRIYNSWNMAHLHSIWVHLRLLWGSCLTIFNLLCSVLYITTCSFIHFILAIVLWKECLKPHNITNDEHNYMSSYSERGDYGKR